VGIALVFPTEQAAVDGDVTLDRLGPFVSTPQLSGEKRAVITPAAQFLRIAADRYRATFRSRDGK